LARKIKDIWSSYITLHISTREDMNTVLLEIAKEKNMYKARVIASLIETHPDYKKKYKEMKAEGFFQ
jgi:hypothetical protein